MKRTHPVAFASGVVFALGLGLSDMTRPATVLAFLDIAGDWNPALAFVMVGAIAVHLPFALRASRPKARPIWGAHYDMPTKKRIDARLLSGAALFGLGWGTSGWCPGPAIVSLAAPSSSTLLFVASMLLGMWLHALTLQRRAAENAQALAR